jgi:hypothetical protein
MLVNFNIIQQDVPSNIRHSRLTEFRIYIPLHNNVHPSNSSTISLPNFQLMLRISHIFLNLLSSKLKKNISHSSDTEYKYKY